MKKLNKIITIRLDIQTINHLNDIAKQRRIKTGSNITISDLIRFAIGQSYPIPGQSIGLCVTGK